MHHELPLAAKCGVRGQHGDRVTGGPIVTPRRGEHQCADVVDDTAQRRTRGTRDVLLGDVEQRGDRVEVAARLNAGGATPLDGGQPTSLQTRLVPGPPQREPRILAVGEAVAGRLHDRLHPAQRAGQLIGEVGRTGVERTDHQVTELSCPAGAAPQGASQLAQRHRIDSADGTGEQGERLIAGEAVGGRVQHRQQRSDRWMFGERGTRCACCSTGTPAAVSARPSAAPARGTDRTMTAI